MPAKASLSAQENELFELVVISGKGGTGKTSIVASLFALAKEAAVADCDVDAADLHLVLAPSVKKRWPFSGGKTAVIDSSSCTGCGTCAIRCRFDAIHFQNIDDKNSTYQIDPISCEGCGVCEDVCPEKAVEMIQTINGEWFISNTNHGPMTHACLGIAEENSGKLVSLVRQQGNILAKENQRTLLICDGTPGIGCPVIASIAGADMVLIVTEPTLSGLHDFKRVAALCQQFDLKTVLCINKFDINLDVSDQIEKESLELKVPVWGRIRYDESVTLAQVNKKSVVENSDGMAAMDIKLLWSKINDSITKRKDK
ncbi:MAG: ATP-binding protein [Deltaproteobacteria bacterium]|nr:ATP-binding protein [Deltaproteobacteria bacterium]